MMEKPVPKIGEKPRGFTALVVFLIIFLIFNFFTLIGTVGSNLIAGTPMNLPNLFVLLLPAFSLIFTLVGLIGFYKLKKWGWIILLIIGILTILGSLIALIKGNLFSILSLVIWGIILFYLFKVKESFS